MVRIRSFEAPLVGLLAALATFCALEARGDQPYSVVGQSSSATAATNRRPIAERIKAANRPIVLSSDAQLAPDRGLIAALGGTSVPLEAAAPTAPAFAELSTAVPTLALDAWADEPSLADAPLILPPPAEEPLSSNPTTADDESVAEVSNLDAQPGLGESPEGIDNTAVTDAGSFELESISDEGESPEETTAPSSASGAEGATQAASTPPAPFPGQSSQSAAGGQRRGNGQSAPRQSARVTPQRRAALLDRLKTALAAMPRPLGLVPTAPSPRPLAAGRRSTGQHAVAARQARVPTKAVVLKPDDTTLDGLRPADTESPDTCQAAEESGGGDGSVSSLTQTSDNTPTTNQQEPDCDLVGVQGSDESVGFLDTDDNAACSEDACPAAISPDGAELSTEQTTTETLSELATVTDPLTTESAEGLFLSSTPVASDEQSSLDELPDDTTSSSPSQSDSTWAATTPAAMTDTPEATAPRELAPNRPDQTQKTLPPQAVRKTLSPQQPRYRAPASVVQRQTPLDRLQARLESLPRPFGLLPAPRPSMRSGAAPRTRQGETPLVTGQLAGKPKAAHGSPRPLAANQRASRPLDSAAASSGPVALALAPHGDDEAQGSSETTTLASGNDDVEARLAADDDSTASDSGTAGAPPSLSPPGSSPQPVGLVVEIRGPGEAVSRGGRVEIHFTVHNGGDTVIEAVALAMHFAHGVEPLAATGRPFVITKDSSMVFETLPQLAPGESLEIDVVAICTREGKVDFLASAHCGGNTDQRTAGGVVSVVSEAIADHPTGTTRR